ncbi:MAG: M20 family metallopeptidase [Negativicutes bacterium]|nr:M20 family metallopeptidase [Negativicutes bacterium]
MREELLRTIRAEIERNRPVLTGVVEKLFAMPELSGEERLACRLLSGIFRDAGFAVISQFEEWPTAFRAELTINGGGPAVGFICEYDALPDIGHGCGHNVIAAMGVGAALGLRAALSATGHGGRIVVFGTPAEEQSGAKVGMAARGWFDGLAAVMMVHPESYTHSSGASLAMEALEFAFSGRSCHAASAPEKGINALDAVQLTFAGINALRQHILPTARIHGIVAEGGKAPNVVPDYASARFYVRTTRDAYLRELSERVKNCARGAALMTGCQLAISNYEASYRDMNTNRTLSDRFDANLLAAGERLVRPPRDSFGSIDMGDVSYRAPAIHPYISITEDLPVRGHSRDFAAATLRPPALAAMERAATAMAMTGWDVISDQQLRQSVLDEFRRLQEEAG